MWNPNTSKSVVYIVKASISHHYIKSIKKRVEEHFQPTSIINCQQLLSKALVDTGLRENGDQSLPYFLSRFCPSVMRTSMSLHSQKEKG